VITFGVAWFFSRRESLEEYFLNARKSNVGLLVCSHVATVIGAGRDSRCVVAESARTGISFGLASVSAYLTGALILVWLLPKIYNEGNRHNITTIVDYFFARFGGSAGKLAGILQLCLLAVWIAVQAAATASLASILTGLNYQTALWLAALCTIGYTTLGA